MITVHHLENSRSQRILFLLEELEVEYELKSYKRDPNTSLAPKALEEVHPLGKSPVITDGDVTVAARIGEGEIGDVEVDAARRRFPDAMVRVTAGTLEGIALPDPDEP